MLGLNNSTEDNGLWEIHYSVTTS